MVSNVRYHHGVTYLMKKGQFVTLVGLVLALTLCFLAPVPFLFLGFMGFTISGIVMALLRPKTANPESKA